MSLTNQFIDSYVGNPQYLELLRAMLGLTQYEGTAFIALALTGEASATRIADTGGIPRPKIYSTLNSLKDKGLVVEVHEQYKVNVSQVEELLHKSKDLLDGFQKFIERVLIYSRSSATKVQAIKSILKEAIQSSGYHNVPIDSETAFHNGRFEMYIERAFLDGHRTRDLNYSRFREIATKKSYFIDDLIESSTSGIKVSINVLSEEKYQTTSKDMLIPGILATAARFRCEAAILIVLPEVNIIERFERVQAKWAPKTICYVSARTCNRKRCISNSFGY